MERAGREGGGRPAILPLCRPDRTPRVPRPLCRPIGAQVPMRIARPGVVSYSGKGEKASGWLGGNHTYLYMLVDKPYGRNGLFIVSAMLTCAQLGEGYIIFQAPIPTDSISTFSTVHGSFRQVPFACQAVALEVV